MSGNSELKIAVIGLGAQGLVTVKNLLEEGFNVTGFDKNDYIGGIWHYSAENCVSVLPTTVVNFSKERACFTDFPFPDECDSYPTSEEVDRYLNDYCDHFHIRPHLRLGTLVEAIHRDDAADVWTIKIKGKHSTETEDLSFDKLIIATGPHSISNEPEIEDREKFRGRIIHSIAFKDRLQFQGMRVMVVGASNTAADTSTSLVGVASKVYFSHRNGSLIIPRYIKNGLPIDHGLNYGMFHTIETLRQYAPTLVNKFWDFAVNRITHDEFGPLDPAWRLTPAPSTKHQVPTVSDALIPALRAGLIVSTAAPRRIVGDCDVELEDGQIAKVDAIIFCTGYHSDFSILGKHDPTLTSDGSHDCYTPRLYQNILSLDYPDSVAMIGTALVFLPAFLTSDLSSMALAQMWSTKPTSPPIPPLKEMHMWHLQHARWISSLRATHPAGKSIKFSVSGGPWTEWVQRTAGTNVQEHLGWMSLQAWKFWWNDRKFCNLLVNGVYTAPCYRLFESHRRKTWDGARAAIIKMNLRAKQDVERRQASWKRHDKKDFVGGR